MQTMPIGTDLDLLCTAVERAVAGRKLTGAGTIQRQCRVGFVKAGRLALLLEDHGIIGPASPAGVRKVLITEDQVSEVLGQLREAASREVHHG